MFKNPRAFELSNIPDFGGSGAARKLADLELRLRRVGVSSSVATTLSLFMRLSPSPLERTWLIVVSFWQHR